MTELVFSVLDQRSIAFSIFSPATPYNGYLRKRIKIENIYNNICYSNIPLCLAALSEVLSHYGVWFPLGYL